MMVRGPLVRPNHCAYCASIRTHLSLFPRESHLEVLRHSIRCAGCSNARKTVFITGATDGIGLHTAKQLAKMGADVLVHGRRAPFRLSLYRAIYRFTMKDSKGLFEAVLARRTQKKAEAAAKEVSRAGGNKGNVQPYAADLSSLDQTKALAQQIQEDHPTVDVMLNNAGEACPTQQLRAQTWCVWGCAIVVLQVVWQLHMQGA